MSKIKILLGFLTLAFLITIGWQLGSCELANIEFRDDLQDMATELDTHIGFAPPRSDEALRNVIMQKAEKYGIDLDPSRITIRRIGSGEKETLYLAADYYATVRLASYSYDLHFTPTSRK